MSITKDEIKGHANQAVGKVKEVVGHATGDTTLEIKGDVQQVKGSAQNALGKAKDSLKKADR